MKPLQKSVIIIITIHVGVGYAILFSIISNNSTNFDTDLARILVYLL